MSRNEGLDPSYWVNVRTPRVDKRLSALDVHQSDKRPPRKSPDGTYRDERRGPAARARRAARQAHKKTAAVGISFRRGLRDANQSVSS